MTTETTADVLTVLRAADPLDADELAEWRRTHACPRPAGEIETAPPPVRTPRRHWTGAVGAGVAVAVGSTGVALATGLLGGPAPDRVKEHLAELDRGMPADLRYNPDLEHARAVVATASGALYLADLAGGGYCIEVASGGDQPRGASCVPAGELAGRGLDVLAPIPADDDSALFVGGRANDARIAAVRVRYADGTVAAVPFGEDGAWLLEVPAAEHASALDHGLLILGVGRDGAVVRRGRVPALRDDDPMGTAHDADQPIFVSTVSDGADLTKVLGIRGRVNVPGPVRLVLRFPDGGTLPVDVGSTGAFRVDLPAGRQGDLATSPGTLIARQDGTVVATAPVASVAYWRGAQG